MSLSFEQIRNHRAFYREFESTDTAAYVHWLRENKIRPSVALWGILGMPMSEPIPMSPVLRAAIDATDNLSYREFLERLDDGKGGIKHIIESIDPRIPAGVRLLGIKESV